MIPLTILSFVFLLGAVLGLRFKALALIPAIVLVLISVAAAALAQGADLWRPLGAIARLDARATRPTGAMEGRTDSRSIPLRTLIE
jgi:hypothetical protein